MKKLFPLLSICLSFSAKAQQGNIQLSTDLDSTGVHPQAGGIPYRGTLIQPFTLTAKDSSGNVLAGLGVTALTSDSKGKAFLGHSTTDANGQVKVSALVGADLNQTLTLSVSNGQDSQVLSVPFQSRDHSFPVADGIDEMYQGSTYIWSTFTPPTGFAGTSFRSTIIPNTDPAGTYYCAGEADGTYFGLQECYGNCSGGNYSKQLIFSVWNNGTQSAQVIDAQALNCISFSGEGTGWSCTQQYDWAIGKKYQFTLAWNLGANFVDYTLFLQNLSDPNSVAQKIGTLRYNGFTAQPGNFSPFVEDFARTTDQCYAKPIRSMTIADFSFVSNGVSTSATTMSAGFGVGDVGDPTRLDGCAEAYAGPSLTSGWDIVSGQANRETNPFAQHPFGSGNIEGILPK